jgi:hypothetical protein
MALVRHGLIETEIATKRGIRMTPEGWRVAGVQSRLELLEGLYLAAAHWNATGYVEDICDALQAISDFDAAAAERAA